MAAADRKARVRSPIVTAVGLLLLAVPGFALGLLAGVAWEEPGLLASHLLGRTTEITLADESPGEDESLPDVAARPGDVTRLRPEVLSPGGRQAVAGVASAPPAAAPPSASSARPSTPPSAASAAKVASAPVPVPGRFAVQVGAFSESATAERLASRLRDKGWEVYVSPGAKAGESRWRVRVGPHSTREAAAQAAARLKTQEKLPTWVLDEDGPA
ncbi:MAG: SPOR domain-containing protein [Myxococcota bacterium]